MYGIRLVIDNLKTSKCEQPNQTVVSSNNKDRRSSYGFLEEAIYRWTSQVARFFIAFKID